VAYGWVVIDFSHQLYAPQTKILEGGTKEEIRVFEALFKGVSTRFGLRTIEKCCENHDFIFCSAFQQFSFGRDKRFHATFDRCVKVRHL
jgi:hypothetical protein